MWGLFEQRLGCCSGVNQDSFFYPRQRSYSPLTHLALRASLLTQQHSKKYRFCKTWILILKTRQKKSDGKVFRLIVNMYLLMPRNLTMINSRLQYSDVSQSPIWSVSVMGWKWNIEDGHWWVFSEAAVSPQKGQKCSGPSAVGSEPRVLIGGNKPKVWGARPAQWNQVTCQRSCNSLVAETRINIRICRFCILLQFRISWLFSCFIQQIIMSSTSATVVCFCAQRWGLFSLWKLVKMCGFLDSGAKTKAIQNKHTQKPSKMQAGPL